MCTAKNVYTRENVFYSEFFLLDQYFRHLYSPSCILFYFSDYFVILKQASSQKEAKSAPKIHRDQERWFSVYTHVHLISEQLEGDSLV